MEDGCRHSFLLKLLKSWCLLLSLKKNKGKWTLYDVTISLLVVIYEVIIYRLSNFGYSCVEKCYILICNMMFFKNHSKMGQNNNKTVTSSLKNVV